MRVKEVVLRGILRVNFAEPHSMGKMNYTHICLQSITLAIYAKGGGSSVFYITTILCFDDMSTGSVHDFSLF